MESRTEAIRHLAATIHGMRPEWDTGGIRAILDRDSRPIAELTAIAVAGAADPTAPSPGVIPPKEMPGPRSAPRPGNHKQPPHIREFMAAPKQPELVARRGA